MRWMLFKALSLETGGDYLLERLTGTIKSQSAMPAGVTGTLPLRFGPNTTYALAGYVKAEWNADGGLALLPGVRLDYFKRINETVADPRLMARYEFMKGAPSIANLAAKAGVGMFRQPPSQLETNPRIGDPDLSAQPAIHTMLGMKYRPFSELLVEVGGRHTSSSISRDAVLRRLHKGA